METILDTGHSWLLSKVVYHDALEIHIVEAIKSAKPEKIQIAGVDLGEGYSAEVTETSRRFVVIFEDVIAYQVTKESYTTSDEEEAKTEGVLSKCERSRYLNFIRSQTLIDSLRPNPYTHFSLALQDDSIDVIAQAEPRIELLH